MKNLILLVLLSLFILPALLYGGKYQIEGTQFDFSAATTSKLFSCSGNIHGGDGEYPHYLEGVKVEISEKVNNSYNKIDMVKSDSEGDYSLSNLEYNKEYLLTFKKPGFKSLKYKFFKHQGGFGLYLYMFKNNFWRAKNYNGSSIVGTIINKNGKYVNDSRKVTIIGATTNYKNSVNTVSEYSGIFQFFGLKPDTYTLKVKNKTIKLIIEKDISAWFYEIQLDN